MARGFFNVPKAVNDRKRIRSGFSEREEVLATYKTMFNSNMMCQCILMEQKLEQEIQKYYTPHDHNM